MLVIERSNGAAIFTMSRASFGQPVRRRYPESQITGHSELQMRDPPLRQRIRRVVALWARSGDLRIPPDRVAGLLNEAAFFRRRAAI
jgi:hypothetical protein